MKMRHTATLFATFLALGLTGCVRTPDGSLEPRYVPEVKSVGKVPVVALKPNRQEPEQIFPRRPASAPPPQLVEVPDAAVRRRPVSRVMPPPPREETVTCRQVQSADGRVRMDCS